jgi:phosphoglycolate phosphatase-like HAD superfamily hydrolase
VSRRDPFSAPALVLFDIDGTVLRRSGPHHREALVDAVRRVTGLSTTTDGVPMQGMLDRDILTRMMREGGATASLARQSLDEVMRVAQSLYTRRCPDLRSRVCVGVRPLLSRLRKAGIPAGLVTGNLSRIAWTKMRRAGLRPYFRFGAFSEEGSSRAGLARLAIRRARREGWINRRASITLVGDHANDIIAARANRIRSIAVATGLSGREELATHEPDLLLDDLRELAVDTLLEP